MKPKYTFPEFYKHSNITVLDASPWAERVFAVLDDGFAICELLCDNSGQPVDIRFASVNPKFEKHTGIVNAVGRTALEVAPHLESGWLDFYGRVALGGETLRFENYAKDLNRWFSVFATPVGQPAFFAIICRDITTEKRLEKERQDALERTGQLLQELNHRMMNSLGMIAAIISVESGSLDSKDGKAAMNRLRTRIETLATLYRQLTTTSGTERVDARRYLSSLASGVVASLAIGKDVRIDTEVEDAQLDLSTAIPLALITNELVTNALKYAFERVERPQIGISLSFTNGHGRLVVRDNGNGFGSDSPQTGAGVGNHLIEAFTQQLGGTLDRRSGRDGTRVVIDFALQPALQAPAA